MKTHFYINKKTLVLDIYGKIYKRSDYDNKNSYNSRYVKTFAIGIELVKHLYTKMYGISKSNDIFILQMYPIVFLKWVHTEILSNNDLRKLKLKKL
jgi:hypothetical protein